MFRQLSGREREAVRAAVRASPLLSQAAADRAAATRFEEVLGRHARPARFNAGEIVCRKGDYGGLLYFVLEGTLREVIADRDDLMSMADLPRLTTTQPKRSLWNFWKKQDEDDIVVVDTHVRQTLANVEEVLGRCETRCFEPASEQASETIVGGLAALTRSPFPRTVFAETPVRLLAMHWRGMRDLIGLCEPVRRAVNAQCCADIIDLIRSGAFETPALSLLSQDALAELVKSADFRFTGSGASEFTAVRQGEAIHEVFMVVSGFGRVRRESAGQRRSVGFVRRGDMFGLAALAAGGHGAQSATTLDFLGNVSALVLPAEATVEHCLPFLSDEDVAAVDPASGVEASVTRQPTRAELRNRSNEARMVDFLVDNAFVRGRQAMVIDQARCVGCDACVRACADTHAGVPRFVRAGPARGGFVVANACMHCEEAPCLVNCPTDAVFRKFSGEVVLSEMLCVGCGTCATACPYDNIRLVEMGRDVEQKESWLPVAVKCDLCFNQKAGPACVRACPHDAVARVDLTDHDLVPRLVNGVPLKALDTKGR